MFLCCNDKCTKRVVLVLKELENQTLKDNKEVIKKITY